MIEIGAGPVRGRADKVHGNAANVEAVVRVLVQPALNGTPVEPAQYTARSFNSRVLMP